MARAQLISSVTNPRIKSLVALRRRRAREQAGMTLLEGYEELALAVHGGVEVQTAYFCPALMLDPAAQLPLVDELADRGAEVVELSRDAFEKAAYREGPDGFLAVVPAVDRRCAQLDLPSDALVLVCQGVEKPGNLGAMLRTADAAGVAAVIAADPVTDWGNPNLVRSSKATVFSVPVASDDTATVLGWLREQGFTIVATTPDTPDLHTQVSYAGRVAVLVGTEKYGLTDDALAAADHRVRIPMSGLVNSLNVATAAAIVVYEAVRQRA